MCNATPGLADALDGERLGIVAARHVGGTRLASLLGRLGTRRRRAVGLVLLHARHVQ